MSWNVCRARWEKGRLQKAQRAVEAQIAEKKDDYKKFYEQLSHSWRIFPLDIRRQTLQQNKTLRVTKKNLVKEVS